MTLPGTIGPAAQRVQPAGLAEPWSINTRSGRQTWRQPDDFVFRFNGSDVGRTYADGTPQGPRWYWSIFGINLRGPLPAGVVVQGLADDLEAAKTVFKDNWERLLAASSVKPEK